MAREVCVCDLPVDGADAGYVVLRADALREEPVPDLPGEHGRVVLLVVRDGVHDARRRHLRLGAADHARLEVARLVEPAKRQDNDDEEMIESSDDDDDDLVIPWENSREIESGNKGERFGAAGWKKRGRRGREAERAPFARLLREGRVRARVAHALLAFLCERKPLILIRCCGNGFIFAQPRPRFTETEEADR